MCDTWTLSKQLEDVKEDVKNLQEIAHTPIFTKELVEELFSRIDKLEERANNCSCGKNGELCTEINLQQTWLRTVEA